MTAPIGGLSGPGPKRIGLDIAGEGGIGRMKPAPTDGPSFSDTLKRAIGEVSTAQDTAQDAIGRFTRGEPVELHQVMAAAEEAQISLEMLVELRNKLMDAYKTVMNMS
ncbi:MAG: flagellar hook-basal body complex protein FliE [bacterium]